MIQEDGDIYIGRGTEGPTDWEKVQVGGGLGQPHVLRVEWTGTEALFSVDAKLVKSLPCNDFGWWGSLYASAFQGGKTINTFDWAAWTFK